MKVWEVNFYVGGREEGRNFNEIRNEQIPTTTENPTI